MAQSLCFLGGLCRINKSTLKSQYWKDFMEIMNSDYLVDRRNGLKLNVSESEIADAAKSSANGAKGAINYLLSKATYVLAINTYMYP